MYILFLFIDSLLFNHQYAEGVMAKCARVELQSMPRGLSLGTGSPSKEKVQA